MNYLKTISFFITIILLTHCMRAAKAESFRIVTCSYPPFEYQENGEQKGLDIAILNLIEKRRNINLNINFLPWNRALLETKSGRADAIFSLVINDERKKFIEYTNVPLYRNEAKLFSAKHLQANITKLEDLKGYTVGLEAGNTYGKNFDNTSFFLKDLAANQKIMIDKFHARRTDFIITAEPVGKYLLKKKGITKYKIHPFVVTTEVCHIGVSKRSKKAKKLLKILNEELLKMDKSGELKRLRKKYLN